MKRQLVLRIEAEAGIAEAVNFYKVQSESTLQNFIEILDETFDKILDSTQYAGKQSGGLISRNFRMPSGLKLSPEQIR